MSKKMLLHPKVKAVLTQLLRDEPWFWYVSWRRKCNASRFGPEMMRLPPLLTVTL